MTERRKKVERFENLLVWQKGMETVKQVYLISKEDELGRDFALWDQLRQAAISIPTNIAEGLNALPARNMSISLFMPTAQPERSGSC